MTQPRVSIVMPTYNQADFLREALESVCAQTMADWELVIINNFSEDHSEEVVKSFDDSRITLVNFANNGIIAAARNKGVALAKADWIAFLDSDDKWIPEKLERCFAALEDDVDVLGHAMNIVRDGKIEQVRLAGPVARSSFRSLLFDGSCATPSAALVRKVALDRVGGSSEDADFRTAEDYELWLKLAKTRSRFKFIHDVLTDYRMHETSASRKVAIHLHAGLTIVGKHYQDLPKQPFDLWRFKKRIAELYYGAARSYTRQGERKTAFSHLLQSLGTFPFLPRSYIAMGQVLLGLGEKKRGSHED